MQVTVPLKLAEELQEHGEFFCQYESENPVWEDMMNNKKKSGKKIKHKNPGSLQNICSRLAYKV